ncbi:MAG: helix-turn-helix domain-containing protein [Alphaproteobacteria bacterium]|nr:helix-turn-helix domain-containing protein [Alphaproteobacteria bacterium]
MARKAPPLDDYVVETLMPDLVGHDRALSAFIVYVKLWHAAGGPGRPLAASLSTLAVDTGLSKSSVQAALRQLRKRGFLNSKRAGPTAIPAHIVLAPWRR